MKHMNMRRRLAALSATTLTLGLVASGASVLSAGATGSDGVNTSSKTITIGGTFPLTGPAAAGFQDVAKAALATFDYVNGHGQVNGWSVDYKVLDDCYNLGVCGAGKNTDAQTQALVNTPVFATVGSLGTATQQGEISYLKTNNTPQLFVSSGAHFWNDPSSNPNLFGFQTNYLAEGKIFGTYISSKFKGKKVGFLGQNDDFGQDGLQGLKNGGVTPATADQLTYNSKDVVFNPGTFRTSMAKLQSDKVAVVVLDTIPQGTKLALDAAKSLGFKPQFIISGVGSDPQTVNDTNEKGAITFTFFNATNATSNKASAWNAWASKVLTAESGKTVNGVKLATFTSKSILSGNQLYGVAIAAGFIEALNKVTANGGTPTRSNFVSALTSNSLSTPAILLLAYSSTNHQGLTGGYLVSVTATGQATGATKAVNTTVYSVNPTTQALTTSKLTNAAVPSEFK